MQKTTKDSVTVDSLSHRQTSMKKYLLLLTASLSLTVAHGQTNTYHSIPDSAFWRIDILVSSPMGGGCMATYYFHYYSSGDTLLNSLVHKKIYKSFVALTSTGPASPCNPIPPIQTSGYVGALIDDSIAKKTFFVLPGYNNDTLRYDYNLIAGDTVKGFIGLYCTTTVSSVDSILINGQYRKRWNCNACGNINQYIIEGIGTNYGLIERFASSPSSPYGRLICVKDSTNTLFISGYNSLFGCGLIYSGQNEINSKNNFSISPNPFSSQTTLQTAKPLKNASLTVYNSVGQTVKFVDNLSGQTVLFQRDNLPSGLYFVRLTQDGNTISADKFVITDK